MNSFTVNTLFALNPKIVYTFIDDEAVLMGIVDETLFGLNPTGTEILKQLESKPLSLQAIHKFVFDQFEVAAEQCMEDTVSFLKTLLDQQLIVQMDERANA